LTLHGITKPVVLHVRFIGAGVNPIDKAYTVGFEATGTIRRSDFGVTTYLPAVGDECSSVSRARLNNRRSDVSPAQSNIRSGARYTSVAIFLHWIILARACRWQIRSAL